MSNESELVIGGGLCHQLELAVRRNRGTLKDVQWLTQGGNFASVMRLARKEAALEIVTIPDCRYFPEPLIMKVPKNGRLKDFAPFQSYSGIAVDVDYDKPFDVLVKEAFCDSQSYGSNPRIEATTFAKEGNGRRKLYFEIVQFLLWGQANEKFVRDSFAEAGLRPALFAEQMSFVAQIGAPPVSRYQGLIALGSRFERVVEGLLGKFLPQQKEAFYSSVEARRVGEPNFLHTVSGTKAPNAWKPDNLFLGVRI